MKKIIYLLAFSMLFSCSKSEDNPTNNPTNQNNIAGTYKLTEYILGAGIAVDLNNDGVFNSNLVKECNCFNNHLIIFQSGGTFTSSSQSSSSISDVNGAVTSITCGSSTNSAGTWSENAINVFTVGATSGGSSTFIKEGNNLRISERVGVFFSTFLYTKQ